MCMQHASQSNYLNKNNLNVNRRSTCRNCCFNKNICVSAYVDRSQQHEMTETCSGPSEQELVDKTHKSGAIKPAALFDVIIDS